MVHKGIQTLKGQAEQFHLHLVPKQAKLQYFMLTETRTLRLGAGKGGQLCMWAVSGIVLNILYLRELITRRGIITNKLKSVLCVESKLHLDMMKGSPPSF